MLLNFYTRNVFTHVLDSGAKYFVAVGARVRGEVPGADRAQPQELGDDHAEDQREEVSYFDIPCYLLRVFNEKWFLVKISREKNVFSISA